MDEKRSTQVLGNSVSLSMLFFFLLLLQQPMANRLSPSLSLFPLTLMAMIVLMMMLMMKMVAPRSRT